MQAPDPIALSALQHWQYCPRQCALIHLEQVFDDNVHTLRGHAVHARADCSGTAFARGVRVERALPLWHDELGLIGKADVVEFLSDGTPYPVEYKHGSRNKAPDIAACDDVQLAAQAMCLEHMSGKPVLEGALYYASSKRRRTLRITRPLREQVITTVQLVRQMLEQAQLPQPLEGEQAQRRCRACSLQERCQPLVTPKALAQARKNLFEPDA